jgi:hypothetical protein
MMRLGLILQASALAEDRTSSHSLRTEPLNALNGERAKDRIRPQLACHRRIAPGGMASREQFPFEHNAAGHTGSCQRRGN